jgi:hypothetical protein
MTLLAIASKAVQHQRKSRHVDDSVLLVLEG